MRLVLFALSALLPCLAQEFQNQVRPALETHCAACHNPKNPKNRINFLAADDETDLGIRRVLWRDVAVQLRNRTMPPGNHKLTEADRLYLANWIDQKLRTTACAGGEFAGFVPPRRLNRREYRNTVREIFGFDAPVAEYFPADEAGGAGFDTNGETLYIPPMLLERYLEAAKKIAAEVIASPPYQRVYLSWELEPKQAAPPPETVRPTRVLAPGEEVKLTVNVFADGVYNLRVSVERPRLTPFTVQLLSDGQVAGKFDFARDSAGGATARAASVEWAAGTHEIVVRNGQEKIDFYSLTVEQKLAEPSPAQRAMHHRLLGIEAGETPARPREAARRAIARLLPKAFRRPVDEATIEKYLSLFDRSAKRGEPFTESMRLVLRGVLLHPEFLFRIDDPDPRPGIRPLGDFALASRLSYFLWSTPPDQELWALAEAGRLREETTLMAQLTRMMEDPRSRALASAFAGQWLGTQEIGGRAVPLLTELQHFYTPEIAADLREQPGLLLHDLLQRGGSILELLDGRETFLTARLARFYQVEDHFPSLPLSGFHKVSWPDERRTGVWGLASVLAMTSHYKQASPVLRGAWVLDTLLGTPVPPPPPDVPSLEEAAKGHGQKKLTVREMLALHRENTACAACHNIMDPVGLALENFDWMGRWREKEEDGRPVDASAKLASGESFTGPEGLRGFLLGRKDDFTRHFAGKLMGYALGRPLGDEDQCKVEAIAKTVAGDGYSAKTLLREIVLSPQFRFTQGDAAAIESRQGPKKEPRRLLGTK
jgi:mono/diheme cytochrome c family protein